MKKMKSIAVLTALVVGAVAYADVIFDAATGTGFIGKGDVQLALGYNNAELQANADSLVFEMNRTVVTEVSWICTNDRNENIQERERTTTTQITAVLSSVARVRNQVTGFILNGFAGTTQTSTTDGPPRNSCPSGPWSLTTPAGDPVTVSDTFQLLVDGVNLPITPAPVL
jgi:hypothetical protein